MGAGGDTDGQTTLGGAWSDAGGTVEEAAAVAGDGGPRGEDVVRPGVAALPDAEDTVSLAVTQVDYKVEGRGDDETPYVHVFGRTEDGALEHVRVRGFRPYFYAPTDSIDEEDLAHDRITGWEEYDDDGEPYESIRGERLTKVFGQTPRDVGEVRDRFDHYEADILFPNRFLIDKDVRSGVRVPDRRAEDVDGLPDHVDGDTLVVHHTEVEPAEVYARPRVHTLDIEVDDRRGFPEDGEEEVLCLTAHDSEADEYVTWLYVAPDLHEDATVPDDLPGYDPISGESVALDVRSFESEPAMLADYVAYVEQTDPCLVTGWNVDDFDVPYLLDRLERLDDRTDDYDLDPDRLSRIGEVWRSDWGGPDVKGRVVFDLLRGYRSMVRSELDSYRLDAVGEEELGVGKERYPGNIGDLWEDDPTRLLEYNLRDVEICVELDRTQEVVAFYQEVAAFVGCRMEDAPTAGDAVDMYVLHKAHGEFALPSKGQVEEGEEFEGGAVFEPVTGVKEMVSVLDLKCFSADTEVLTPEGPEQITDVDVGDEVYTLNSDTHECEIKPVEEVHQYKNRFGELHHVSGTTHDLKVTENHRFLISDKRGWDDQAPEDFEFVEYRDIPENRRFAFPQHEPMSGDAPETFDLVNEVDDGTVVVYYEDDLRAFRNRMPSEVRASFDLVHGSSQAMGIQKKVGKYLLPVSVYRRHRESIDKHADAVYLKYAATHRETPLSFAMEDWLEFLAWYVTEGSLDSSNGRLTLHQDDGPAKEAIQGLLDRMELNYNTGERGVNISNRFLFEWFEEHCGKGYAHKRLPEWVFELDGELLKVLLDTMIRGDGTRTESGLGKFWTKSDELKDGIVDIAVRCGHKPTVSKQSDGTWYVSIGKRGSFEKATNATVEEHEGDVHCITAKDNHVVLAGRNGHFQWVGQSLYPMAMRTINASPETKVDEGYDGAVYEAPNGTRFRKQPDGIMREMITELLDEREEKKARRDDHDPGSEQYQLYDRQQSAVKVIMNCFTPDTDVLTPEGVRNVRDLDVGDEVYSLDPDAMEMEVKPVVETHAYPEYDGELVDVETEEIDFRVTPNHRMLVRKDETNGTSWDEDDYRFVEAGDLDRATNYQLPHDWDGPDAEPIDEVDLTELLGGDYEVWADNDVHGHTLAAELGYYPDEVPKNDLDTTGYVFSAEEFEEHRDYLDDACSRFYVHAEPNRKWVPRFYDGDDFLELLAWYVTEGNVHHSEEKQFGEKLRGSATTVKIAQEKRAVADGEEPAMADGGESDHAAIGALLDRMGFDYYVDDRCYQFTSRLHGEMLEDLCGSGSENKRVPDLVFEVSRDQKRLFLDALLAGDGDRHENSWRYSTASEELRDGVLRLCAHLGLTASYSRDSGCWRVYVTEGGTNTLRLHRSGSRSTAEDGVYCVTVADNHTLLAGRNGKFQFVGQSLYGVSGWTRFRLYDKDAAAAVTATGRAVIEFTEEVASGLDYRVTYGDSVTGDRPIVVRDPEGRIRIEPIEELFGEAERRATNGTLVTADGGPVAEVSIGKERRGLPEWEALSLSKDGGPEWQPIEAVIRHGTDKPVVKLQHKFGESTTTLDHSYVAEEGGELVEVTPENVEEPLRVSDLPTDGTIESLDVYDVLEGYTREYEDGRSVGADDARTKVKDVHADDEHVWFGHEHHGDLDSTIKVKRHIAVGSGDGRALLRLLAAYITEGSASTVETTDSKFGVSIAESRRDWLEQLQDDYHRLFENAEAGIVESDTGGRRVVEYETADGKSEVEYDDGTLKLQMMNELAAVLFREFAGQTSRGKRIPSFVFHLPEVEQDRFIEMLVEGDGSRVFPRYTSEYSERNFDFETTSRELAAGLSMLLIQRDKKHSLKYRDSKGSYTVRTCDYYRDGRDPVLTDVEHDGYVYDLSVAENDNFVDAVGGVVLHNTDSVMLELGGDVTVEEAIEQSFDVEERINDSYGEFAERLGADEHFFEIEFEKLYRRFFQAGKKKRYAGHVVWSEGKEVDDVDITGFEYKRSDIAPITKEVQERVIEMIVRGEDIEDVKAHVHGVIEDFRAGAFDPEEVAIPSGIGKRLDNYDTDTAHVRGARYANHLLGTNFDRGSKPKRLYLRKVHPDFFERVERERGVDTDDPVYREFKVAVEGGDGVICFEYADQLPEEFEIDWDKMLDKTLRGPIARVLEAMGVSWEEVRSGQEQTGLGSFT